MKAGDLVRIRKRYAGFSRIIFMDPDGFTIPLDSSDPQHLVYLGEEVWNANMQVVKLLHSSGRIWYARREHICKGEHICKA